MGIRNLSTASISTGAKRSKFWDQSATTANPAMDSIATLAVTSGTVSSVVFDNIPQTYKHLELRMYLRDNRAVTGYGETNLIFNNVTTNSSSVYYKFRLYSNASTINGTYYANIDQLYGPSYPRDSSYTGVFGAQVWKIEDYTNTNKHKAYLAYGGFNGTGSDEISYWAGAWTGTSALTRIDILPNQTGFNTYSHFALYGIKG
jgi:hypothetical protein